MNYTYGSNTGKYALSVPQESDNWHLITEILIPAEWDFVGIDWNPDIDSEIYLFSMELQEGPFLPLTIMVSCMVP
jgi:hypothetical protein